MRFEVEVMPLGGYCGREVVKYRVKHDGVALLAGIAFLTDVEPLVREQLGLLVQTREAEVDVEWRRRDSAC